MVEITPVRGGTVIYLRGLMETAKVIEDASNIAGALATETVVRGSAARLNKVVTAEASEIMVTNRKMVSPDSTEIDLAQAMCLIHLTVTT